MECEVVTGPGIGNDYGELSGFVVGKLGLLQNVRVYGEGGLGFMKWLLEGELGLFLGYKKLYRGMFGDLTKCEVVVVFAVKCEVGGGFVLCVECELAVSRGDWCFP